MNRLRRLHLRLRALFAKRQLDAEMSEEMRAHVELQTQENIEAGMNPKEARFTALRQFGHLDGIKERCREQRTVAWMEGIVRDLRFAIRQLVKTPVFTGIAVFTLALGIGATTAIVSVVRTAVFDPLPAENSERLVQLGVVREGSGWWPDINRVALHELRQQTNLFARVAAYEYDGFDVGGRRASSRRGGRVGDVGVLQIVEASTCPGPHVHL